MHEGLAPHLPRQRRREQARQQLARRLRRRPWPSGAAAPRSRRPRPAARPAPPRPARRRSASRRAARGRRGRGPRSACRACQPPASSMAARRQMPAVPLKLKKQPLRWRAACSMAKWPSSSIACTRVSERVVAVEVAPARLHHADSGVGEPGHEARAGSPGRGTKSASKTQSSSPRADGEPAASAPALKPLRSRAVQVVDVEAARRAARRQRARRWRVVSSVESSSTWISSRSRGIVERGDGARAAARRRTLVVERQLHGDRGQPSSAGGGGAAAGARGGATSRRAAPGGGVP